MLLVGYSNRCNASSYGSNKKISYKLRVLSKIWLSVLKNVMESGALARYARSRTYQSNTLWNTFMIKIIYMLLIMMKITWIIIIIVTTVLYVLQNQFRFVGTLGCLAPPPQKKKKTKTKTKKKRKAGYANIEDDLWIILMRKFLPAKGNEQI